MSSCQARLHQLIDFRTSRTHCSAEVQVVYRPDWANTLAVSAISRNLLFQRKCVQRRPALYAHILLSIDHVSHGPGGNGWSEIGFPEELAIAGIEGDELAVAAAGEQHI